MNQHLEQKKVEPNSGLGQAIGYVLRHQAKDEAARRGTSLSHFVEQSLCGTFQRQSCSRAYPPSLP